MVPGLFLHGQRVTQRLHGHHFSWRAEAPLALLNPLLSCTRLLPPLFRRRGPLQQRPLQPLGSPVHLPWRLLGSERRCRAGGELRRFLCHLLAEASSPALVLARGHRPVQEGALATAVGRLRLMLLLLAALTPHHGGKPTTTPPLLEVSGGQLGGAGIVALLASKGRGGLPRRVVQAPTAPKGFAVAEALAAKVQVMRGLESGKRKVGRLCGLEHAVVESPTPGQARTEGRGVRLASDPHAVQQGPPRAPALGILLVPGLQRAFHVPAPRG